RAAFLERCRTGLRRRPLAGVKNCRTPDRGGRSCLDMARLHTPRWAWVLTGSGHFFTESFDLIHGLEHCDIFVTSAANEVLRMYKLKLDFPDTMRVLHDKTASAVPVGGFYHGVYHTVVIAPAT